MLPDPASVSVPYRETEIGPTETRADIIPKRESLLTLALAMDPGLTCG